MTSWDIATSTAIGTGTSKTQLNAGNPLTKPTQATELIEVVPYMASTAAHTAAESVLAKVIIESNSINLLHKVFMVPPILGGLGTFPGALTPMLDAVECRTPLQLGATQQFNIYGQAFESNTVAPRIGLDLHYSETSSGLKEHFYDMPTNETSTGTAATSVAGEDLTINDGTFLEEIIPVVVPGTVTAAESIIGHISVTSNDFGNSMPLKVAVQPIGTGLGSAIGVGIPKLPTFKNIHMPMKSSCLISQSYTQEEAVTAAGTFIAGFGYVK